MVNLADLPLDILLQVAFHINTAQDFLALCSTCQKLQQGEELRYAPSFWNALTKHKFRVPNRPIVEADGKRWCNLYRRLLKETRVYVWGNNDRGSLGKPYNRRSLHPAPARRFGPHIVRMPQAGVQDSAGWPQELELPEDIGIITDLQCGGWCTAALTSSGKIFVTGLLQHHHDENHELQQLQPGETYHLAQFQQFSLGRAHLLALGEEGEVFSWTKLSSEAGPLDFACSSGPVVAQKVVAGWDHSSAHMPGIGVVIWKPADSGVQENLAELPQGRRITEPDLYIIPMTTRYREVQVSSISKRREDVDDPFGAVVNWIILEYFIVWVTDLGKVFALPIPEDFTGPSGQPLEIADKKDEDDGLQKVVQDVLDIQGNFRYFALLKANGEVLTSDQDALTQLWSRRHEPDFDGIEPSMFRKIPALQHTGVIQIAFGDWHFHALHADGTITSYGKEMQFCGSLGLGDTGIDAVRGIKATGFGGDGVLLDQCCTNGRRVFFQNEMKDWLNHVRTGGKNKREAESRMDSFMRHDEERAEVSEWFEHRLRKWDDLLPTSSEAGISDDGLPAYFALSVAAAGWHSGALVLQNDEKSERIRKCYQVSIQEHPQGQSSNANMTDETLVEQATSLMNSLGRWFLGLPQIGPHAEQAHKEPPWIWEDESFPRLKLKSGKIMEGEVPVEEWVCPDWK